MRAIHSPTMGGAWVLTAVLVATACHTDSRPRSPGLERQLTQMAITAERDSLLLEVAANGRLLSDIQAELARLQPGKPATEGPESPSLEFTKDQRTFVLDRVKEITTRIKQAESRLATSERRVRRLAHATDSLTQDLTGAKASIAQLSQVVSDQQATIAALGVQVEGLLTENLVLSDSVFRLTDDLNTAYFVAGTRTELLAKGVLVEDGHRGFPLVGKRGVQPARDLPLSEFTSIDRSRIQEIPLPRPDRRYRIISRQNPAYVTEAGGRGEIREKLTIASPEKFWEPSRYLILVEQ
jgi:uncharacterized protein YoxC